MFTVLTYVGQSAIHGNGVFAGEDVQEGQLIWQFAPDLDMCVPYERIAAAPKAFQDYMEMYAYASPRFPGGMILSCDHAKFLNHSEAPNTQISGDTTRASQAIAKGQEITCDYRLFVAGWSGEF